VSPATRHRWTRPGSPKFLPISASFSLYSDSIYLPRKDGRLSWPWWLVIYWDVLLATDSHPSKYSPRPDRESNSRPLDRKFNARPLSVWRIQKCHSMRQLWGKNWELSREKSSQWKLFIVDSAFGRLVMFGSVIYYSVHFWCIALCYYSAVSISSRPPLATHFSIVWSVCLSSVTFVPLLNCSTDLNAIRQVQVYGVQWHIVLGSGPWTHTVRGNFGGQTLQPKHATANFLLPPAE